MLCSGIVEKLHKARWRSKHSSTVGRAIKLIADTVPIDIRIDTVQQAVAVDIRIVGCAWPVLFAVFCGRRLSGGRYCRVAARCTDPVAKRDRRLFDCDRVVGVIAFTGRDCQGEDCDNSAAARL